MPEAIMLVGATASGKSALVRTLVEATSARGARAVVTTARDWTVRLCEALANDAPPREEFAGAAVVAIEHLEDLAGMTSAQAALAESLVRTAGAGSVVVVTATIPRAMHDVPAWIRAFARSFRARIVRPGDLPDVSFGAPASGGSVRAAVLRARQSRRGQ